MEHTDGMDLAATTKRELYVPCVRSLSSSRNPRLNVIPVVYYVMFLERMI